MDYCDFNDGYESPNSFYVNTILSVFLKPDSVSATTTFPAVSGKFEKNWTVACKRYSTSC